MLQRAKNIAARLLPRAVYRLLSAAYRGIEGHPVFIPFRATYNEDELITNKNIEFLEEPRFRQAVRNAVSDKLYVDPDIRWRCHVACWAGSIALRLGGDFVECGVNKGFLSRIVMEYLGMDRHPGVSFYLLDTYEGFDEGYLTAREARSLQDLRHHQDPDKPWQMGIYEPCYDTVLRAFSAYPNAVVIKGPVPQTLEKVKATRVSYLSIDMNCVIPEIAAIEFFWDKLVPGAIVLLDDYAWPGHEEQKSAFDKFARDAGVSLLCLPTGQGLIIKPS